VRGSTTLSLVAAGLLGGGGAALAEERVAQCSRDGVRPQLRAEPGETVRLVDRDPTSGDRAWTTAGAWRYDRGPTALLRGDVVPSALTPPGSCDDRVALDPPPAASVVVAGGPAAAPAPVPPVPSPAPDPPGSPSATPTPPVVAPAVPGPLDGRRSDRGLGLAVAVAAVLVVGVASLLVRLLLALPVPSDSGARL
jgi:hypothetical protein